MTATPGLPIQQTPPSRPARSSAAPDPSRGGGNASDRQGFDAVVSRLRGTPETPRPAGEAGQAGRTRATRSRPLEAEDVLPLEMLQTLYAQQQATPLPQPIMPPGIQNGIPQAPALPDLTQLQGSAAATAGQPGVEMLAQAAADADAQAGQSGAASGTTPALPALPQASMPSSATALPPDFAQQLAAATSSAAPAQAAPQPGRRTSQPGMDATSLPSAPVADTGGPVSAASVMRPVQPQAGAMAESGQTLAADESATARAEFADLLARHADGGARRDGTNAPPEHLRDSPMVVTRQDAMLAPGQPPIAHQAAEKIIAELQSADNAAGSDRAQLSRQGDAPGTTRVLQLQLQPADLGTLTVTLSMRDQMLDIKLEAAEQRTARMLETDREKLTEILRSAGYALDGVTVQISSPEKPVQSFQGLAGQGGEAQGQQGGQPQSSGAQADAQRGQQSQRGNEDRSFASRTDGGDHGPRRVSADGDLYL